MGAGANSAGVGVRIGVSVARAIVVDCGEGVTPAEVLKNPGTITKNAIKAAATAKTQRMVSKKGRREKRSSNNHSGTSVRKIDTVTSIRLASIARRLAIARGIIIVVVISRRAPRAKSIENYSIDFGIGPVQRFQRATRDIAARTTRIDNENHSRTTRPQNARVSDCQRGR